MPKSRQEPLEVRYTDRARREGIILLDLQAELELHRVGVHRRARSLRSGKAVISSFSVSQHTIVDDFTITVRTWRVCITTSAAEPSVAVVGMEDEYAV